LDGTDAPPYVVAELRCLGPLLALVQCYNDLSAREHLEETSLQIEQRIANDVSYELRFDAALRLWRRHVQDVWPNVPSEHDASILRYRVSCLRTDSKRYPFTRRELLGMVGDCVVPTCHQSTWSVHLTQYNLEIVLFQHPDCLLVGFALRPYQLLHTRSFASGEWPPDVATPFVPASLRMVRLRTTTAQVLLHLAQLQAGDVVLDPCAGVGTIPLEAAHLPKHLSVVSLGGDLVLHDPAFQAVAVEYRAACVSSSDVPVADVMAWDATHLPIRSESVDAIVTDLPFGQLCLSAKKLDALLPLLLAEMARVVRRGTGRLVLLCGSYAPILKALQYANERLVLDSNSSIWEVPCTAVFPVNIGGNLAWIIHVRRGLGALAPVPGQRDRIRKLVHKREHTEKMMQGSLGNKPKHPQA
jgi:ubiquinone/menaquinone biosynthesis C-methylase UbiE